MPRFHFPIVDGITLDDPVGIELKSEAEAGKHAESIADHVSNIGHKKPRTVLAIDENGVQIHRAPVKND